MTGLYHSLPYGLKSTVISVMARLKVKQKYGKYFQEYFDFLMSHDVKQQQAQADEDLHRYLDGIRKKNIPGISSDLELHNMPIIDKSYVLKNFDKLILDKPFKTGSSSGTSGQPVKIPYSRNVYEKEYSFWWYHRSFGGVKRGERVATFAGHKIIDVNRTKPPFWVYNIAEKQLFFSSYNITEASLKYYVQELNRFKPAFIHGYPSSIYLLAKYIFENNIQLDFVPKMIAPASETTLDFQRKVIEMAFKTKVYIWYGNTELAGHITECPQGKLHIQPYHSYIRIINFEGNDVKPGEEGMLVATNFHNHAFAMLNYNTKDIVRVSENQFCTCNKGGKIVDYIMGRIEDYIYTPEGRKVGRLDHLFKNAKFVKNAQLIQKDIEELVIRIEKEPNYNTHIEKIIIKEARKRLGDNIKLTIDYDNPIRKEINGKFQFIVQKIKRNN